MNGVDGVDDGEREWMGHNERVDESRDGSGREEQSRNFAAS